jgi:predicted transcriptional regulator of viral defense system
VVLSRLVSSGKLVRVVRGLYVLPPVKDPFRLVRYLSSGYIAFYSALYVHKLADVPPTEILIATPGVTRTRVVGEVSFREVKYGERFCGFHDGEHRVSDLPKTIYDCFHRPELGGGFPVILKAVHNSGLDPGGWGEVLAYARRFDTPAFFQRLGYLLSLLPRPPEGVVDACRSRVGGSRVYLSGRGPGVFVREWNVVDNVGRGVLVSWMRG